MPQNGFGFESGKLVMMHLFPECDFCSCRGSILGPGNKSRVAVKGEEALF